MAALGLTPRSNFRNSLYCFKLLKPAAAASRSLHQSTVYTLEHHTPSVASQTIPRRTYELPHSTIYEHTRPQPRAPVRTRPAVPVFRVNDDEAVLNHMYGRLFGPSGIQLTSELKWQAVTHKSFDHGRQPYNDKLAFMGRRVLFYHANIHLINQTPAGKESSSPTNMTTADREPIQAIPFNHSNYKNINNATYSAVGEITSEESLIKLARMAGIQQVMRWIPRDPEDLIGSGQDNIAVEGLYAIIGAIALTRGGYAAAEFTRSRVFNSQEFK